MRRVEPDLGNVFVASAVAILHVVVGDDVAAARRAHQDDLVEGPGNVVLDQVVGGSVTYVDAIAATTRIRIFRAVEVRVADDIANRSIHVDAATVGMIGLDVLDPRVHGQLEVDIPATVAAFAVVNLQVFETRASDRGL